MRSKDDLHHLIQAMSKSEKRYFVLDAKKSGRSASRYLTLFETINAMEEHDEEALKTKFPKNLSSDKAYLYEAILRSMRDYRSKSSKAAQVKERLMDAKYLYERGLYQQSGDRIVEAKALAKELEDNFSLLEIIKEEQLSLYDRRVRVDIEQIEKLQKERESVLRGTKEELDYLGLYFRLLAEVHKEENLKDERGIKRFNERFPERLFDENELPKQPLAKRRFFLAKAIYYRLLGDIHATHKSYSEAVKWWEKYPAIKSEEFNRYVSDVANLVNISYKDERYFSVANNWLNKLNSEDSGRTYHEKKYVFLYLSVSNLLHLLNQGDFESAKKVLPKMIEGIEKFGLKKSIVLLCNITIAYFVVGDFKNCAKWSYQVASLKAGTRDDIQRVVRLLYLVSLYELDKIDELDSAIRSTYRYFKKFALEPERFERVVLDLYLKRIFSAPLNETEAAIREFKNYLLDKKNSPDAENTIGLEEFLIWVNKKLK